MDAIKPNWIVIAFGLILVQLSFPKSLADSKKSLPKFKLQNLTHPKSYMTTDHLKGKIVIVNFWASWCAPCKQELPYLNKLYERFKKRNVLIVGINVDESINSAQSFIKDQQVSFPLLFDKNKKYIEKLKVSTMPTSFVLDPKGRIRFTHKGFRKKDKSKFLNEIKTLIRESKKPSNKKSKK